MITNFKIFEGVENNKPKFEQGDYVVRIYDKKQDVCSITKSMRVYDGGYGGIK